MKNTLLLLFCLLYTFSLFAQDLVLFNKWKVRSFSIAFGSDQDRIKNLDYTYMLSTAKALHASPYKDLTFTKQNLYSMACENPNIRLSVSLDVPGTRNTELDLTLYGIYDRYDYVSYHTDATHYPILNEDYEYLSFNSMQSELGLESTIKKRVQLGFFNLYGGLGTNMGYSFSGQMTINGDFKQTANQNSSRTPNDIATGTYYKDYHYDELKTRDGFQQRIFGQIGLGWILFKRLELGVDYRYGYGYRAVFNAPTKTVNLQSAGLSIKWLLW